MHGIGLLKYRLSSKLRTKVQEMSFYMGLKIDCTHLGKNRLKLYEKNVLRKTAYLDIRERNARLTKTA